MKNTFIIIGVLVLVIIGVVFFVAGPNDSTDTQMDARTNTRSATSDFDRVAPLALADYSGNDVSLEQFRGTPLVINSWAVWCPFCREELPYFSALQQEFGDKVTVIAIDRQEPLAKAKDYTDGLGITDDMLFLLDKSDSFYKTIGGFSMPETIFLNSDGEIIVHKRGPMDLAEMREHTNKIIDTNETAL